MDALAPRAGPIDMGKAEMVQSKDKAITLVGVGDISPNRDDPPSIFRFSRDTLRSADIVFGQMESPLSDRGTPQFTPP
jgi:hypothetical protein